MTCRWLASALLAGTTLWTSASDAQAIRFEPASYEYDGAKVEAELGRFEVPLHHRQPHGAKLRLAFLRLKSTASHPGPPIIYLAGGPGGSGIGIAKGPRGKLFLELRKVADVIALDQRGIGLSEPSLACAGELKLRTPTTREQFLSEVEGASRTCAAALRSKGVDLSAFNIVESAHDVDALRQALGAQTMSLWGSSYGSQLGFAVLRHYDRNVSRVVFSGVEGPDHTLKLPRIVERQLLQLDRIIQQDQTLRARYAEPQAVVARRVLERASIQPIAVQAAGASGPVYLGAFDLQIALAGQIGTRTGMAELPATLAALDRRETGSEFIQAIASGMLEFRSFVRSAVPFVIDCQSGSSAVRGAQVTAQGRGALVPDPDYPIPEACGAWGVHALAADERAPVRSKVPILFLSGTLDGRTPSTNVTEIRGGFPNSRHILIDGSGHGHDLFVSSSDIARATLAFFRDGTVPVRRITLPILPIK